MKTIGRAIRILLFMTFLTGVTYPLLVTGLAGLVFPHRAAGSFITLNDGPIGSRLIGQSFVDPKYFQPRPSVTNYCAMSSGGSNLGPTSNDLKEAIARRREHFRATSGTAVEIPLDLLFASASGLDPDITPASARYQVERIVKARSLDQKAKTDIFLLIEKHIETPAFGLLGEPRVNVLRLNLALDSLVRNQ